MKNPRVWYEYDGQKYLVPEHYIYRLHESKGIGFEIAVDFYTYAFNLHGISIVEYKTLYGDQTDLRKPAKTKEDKEETPVGITYFAVACVGRDRKGIIKTGIGEVGNESVNNFQRGFPYGLAAKRSKISMGKEFLNMHEIDLCVDCEDYLLPTGKFKGFSLAEVYKKDRKYVEFLNTEQGSEQIDNTTLFKVKELLLRIENFRKSKAVEKEG